MPRQFTEPEAQRIFARMAEMQRADASGTPGALTVDDLEEAARAAGIDASYVARAVAELDAAPEQPPTFATAPTEVLRQRVVPGTLDDATWAALISAARMHVGQPGVAGQVGPLREWTLIKGGSMGSVVTRLSAEPTEGGVRLMLSESVRELVRGAALAASIQTAFALVFAVVGVVSSGGPGPWLAALGMLLLALSFGAGMQIGSRVWSRRRAAQFETLMDRLDLVVRTTDEADRSEAGGEAATVLDPLGLKSLGDAEDSTEARPPRRVRS